jgi:predicted AAA+ superfamily ATPase
MNVSKDELIGILSKFNPWWRGEGIPDLPAWRRTLHKEIDTWIKNPPVHRALLIGGPRQVGKTTLVLQLIEDLLKEKVPAANIIYATFDHPLLKAAGVDAVLEAWREREPKQEGLEFIFLDEIQFIEGWGTWIKHQVDFFKKRRIIFTGSAMPILEEDQESGVGRWHTIRIGTLSFYEYLSLKNLAELPSVASLEELFEWDQSQFYRTSEMAIPYVGHFNDYLIKGGFPQTALIESVPQLQRLLREDLIDKALKRDMTALFGVRRVLELEQAFLYLCMHDGGILDLISLCSNLSIKRPTAQNFIEILEAAHLIYRLLPFGYGKEVLRGRYKIYLADSSIAPAIFLKGKSILEDSTSLGTAVETTVFKHLYAHYTPQNALFSYWRGAKDLEVDIIMQMDGKIIPFEVKYRSTHTKPKDVQGMLELCKEKNLPKGYVVTQSVKDFGINQPQDGPKLLNIPAVLLCYWLK